MTESHKEAQYRGERGFMLGEALPVLVTGMESLRPKSKARHVLSQLPNVFVPRQYLSGTASSFSFLAYTIPRLGPEDRRAADLPRMSYVYGRLLGGKVRILLDDFGVIGGLRISGLSEMYRAFISLMPASDLPREEWPDRIRRPN